MTEFGPYQPQHTERSRLPYEDPSSYGRRLFHADAPSEYASSVRHERQTSVKISPTTHTAHTALTRRSDALSNGLKDRDALDMMGHREYVEAMTSAWDPDTVQVDLLDRRRSAAGAGQSTSRSEPEVSLC